MIPFASRSIEQIAPDRLKPWARNARTHSKKQIRQVAESIRTFGFTNPVLIDAEHTILAGHCRVEAAKLLGMATVPCIRIETMTPAEKRAYVLADNKLALNAGWDEDLLAEELQALLADDLGFDIGVTGFSIPEIDGLIEGLTPEEPGDPEDDWLPEPGPARCRPGDVWQLGRHRLICGDALDPDVVGQLMDGETGADGLHRSALQREDRRPCRRLGPGQAPRVRHGRRARCRRASSPPSCARASGTWPTPASTARSTTSAWTGGISGRCSTPPTASTPS